MTLAFLTIQLQMWGFLWLEELLKESKFSGSAVLA